LEWVDTRIDPRDPADRYLLCTDGLYNAINDGRLAALLASGAGASGAAIKLVDEALHNGARDNITAVVVIPSCDASRMDGKEWQRS
jgi:protein phosphatase